jgi:tetratricopeptide (TPR) repeat protein
VNQQVDKPYELMKHPLTYVRAQQGWSLRVALREIAKAAEALGINMAIGTPEKIWRWENRGVVPDRFSQRALAHALNVPPERLELLPWPRWLPGAEAVHSAHPWTISGCLDALNSVEDALIDRRGFLTLSGVALTAVASGWASSEPERMIGATKGGRLDAATVAWVEERIPGLRRMDDRLSGASLLRLIRADHHMITELISRSSYPGHLGQRLYRTAADLGQLAGWVVFDIGQHCAAQRYYVAALHAAHVADDRQLGANVLAGLSFQCALVGRPQDGVSLAETAEEHARTASPRVQALIASRQARAHARAGDASACRRALKRAEQMLGRAENTNSTDDPQWVYYFDQAELEAQAGTCFVDLRQPKIAEPFLTRALAAQDRSYVRDRTIYLVRAAKTQIQAGQLDAACGLVGQAAELAYGSYSLRSMESVKDFRKSLKPHASSPHVIALDRQLAALAA